MAGNHVCFVYGTLISQEIYSRVVYGTPKLPLSAHETFQPALLKGYARFGVKGQRYPGIVPDADSSVKGVVINGVSDEGLAKLDEFEIEEYERRLVTLANGTIAFAYIWLDPSTLTDERWDYDEQVKSGLIDKIVKEFL